MGSARRGWETAARQPRQEPAGQVISEQSPAAPRRAGRGWSQSPLRGAWQQDERCQGRSPQHPAGTDTASSRHQPPTSRQPLTSERSHPPHGSRISWMDAMFSPGKSHAKLRQHQPQEEDIGPGHCDPAAGRGASQRAPVTQGHVLGTHRGAGTGHGSTLGTPTGPEMHDFPILHHLNVFLVLAKLPRTALAKTFSRQPFPALSPIHIPLHGPIPGSIQGQV